MGCSKFGLLLFYFLQLFNSLIMLFLLNKLQVLPWPGALYSILGSPDILITHGSNHSDQIRYVAVKGQVPLFALWTESLKPTLLIYKTSEHHLQLLSPRIHCCRAKKIYAFVFKNSLNSLTLKEQRSSVRSSFLRFPSPLIFFYFCSHLLQWGHFYHNWSYPLWKNCFFKMAL